MPDAIGKSDAESEWIGANGLWINQACNWAIRLHPHTQEFPRALQQVDAIGNIQFRKATALLCKHKLKLHAT